MTWTKLPDDHAQRLVIADLPRSARHLLTEVLIWSNAMLTDGAVPRPMLPFLTDSPDPLDELGQLVAAGFLDETPTGWQVRDWTATQEAATTVRARQAATTARTRRWRLHQGGDHSGCDPQRCPAARDAVTNSVRDGVRDGVRDAAPSRPDPTRPDPQGRDGVGSGSGRNRAPDGADAPPGAMPPSPSRGQGQPVAGGAGGRHDDLDDDLDQDDDEPDDGSQFVGADGRLHVPPMLLVRWDDDEDDDLGDGFDEVGA